ncbi:MAG TPA: hypothetical protein VK937_07125 [Candidatus Limnocylindria bacterium]|nr:hypothetical protein [Candidatus Limnocylindria bacterium]
MKHLRNPSRSSFPSLAGLFLLDVFAMLALRGCKPSGHTPDPRLRPIDEMLDSQMPAGTAKSRVMFYLSSQNFPVENTGDPRAIVAVVHHVDSDTLQPATARVTFHFDASDNLKSYELVGAAGSASRP